MATPTQADVDRLKAKRSAILQTGEAMLESIRETRGERARLSEAEKIKLAAIRSDADALETRIAEVAEDVERVGTLPPNLQRRISGQRANAASMLSPLMSVIGDEQLRSAYGKARRGESVNLETRAPGFASGVDLLPPELYPIPTFPIHENRLLNKLPGYALDAPSLEYVQVNTVSGSAAIVGEGAVKPEIQLPATKLICTALKLAVHAGISWECMVDYEAFSQAVRTELMRQVVDLENAELWGGDPAAGGLNSLTKTAGILTFTATGGGGPNPEWYSDIAGAIAHLRCGAALAEPDLILLHPNTFASVRAAKDGYGRFLASVDPSADQADSVWGVDALVSTAFTPGEAVLVDTSKVGRVCVRESLTLRIGYSNDDFVRNIIRSVCEERLNFAIERPAAICHMTNLPTAAPSEAETTKSTKK